MRFGHFDDDAREYVITTPGDPLPWINYLGSEEFFGLISHMAGGYCFYRDARLRRVLRYRYNNVPTDAGGRYFYIKDGDDFWTPTWAPVKARARRRTSAATAWATPASPAKRGGVRAELLFLVPLGTNAEIHQVTLKNEGKARKKLRLFSLVEFCLWNAWDDMTNFQRNFHRRGGGRREHASTTRPSTASGAITIAFYHVNAPLAGFDTDRETFFGLYNGMHEPQVVHERRAAELRRQRLGAHRLARGGRDLAPGEEQDLRLRARLRGEPARPEVGERRASSTRSRRRELIARFSTAGPGGARPWASCARTGTICSPPSPWRSPDEKLNRMVNIWNPYQCMVTFNMSRSASYFETGIGRGMGFRDSNQDLLGFVHLIPERARERILDIASTQFADGSAYHQYQPLTKRGNNDVGSGFNDDPLWLILGVGGLHQGDRRLRHPRRAGALRQRPRRTRPRCSSTCSARSTTS